MNIIGWIFLIALVIFIAMLNNLVHKRKNAQSAASMIDIQLRKRLDLIPGLTSCVKGYMAHEAALLAEIASRRTGAAHSKLAHEAHLVISSVLSQMEAYPELKASESMLDLQTALGAVESQIAMARRSYNIAATQYNNAIAKFPERILAFLFRFRELPVFSLND